MYLTHVRHRYLLIEMKLSILAPLRRHSKEVLIQVFTLTILLQQAQSLTNAEIASYFNSHMNKDMLETRSSNSSHLSFFKKYMNGMVFAPGLPNVTLKEVLEVTHAAEKSSLSHGSTCNASLHHNHKLDALVQGHFFEFVKTVAVRARKGVRYCNFLASFLQCLDDPATGQHTCSCLPDMIWSTRLVSCVFREGQVCARRREVNGVKFYRFDWAITQSAEDFVTNKMPEHCEMDTHCTKMGLCIRKQDWKYLLPLKHILDYFIHDWDNDKRMGTKCLPGRSDCQDYSGKVDEIRGALSALSKPSSAILLQTISLEILGTRHHLKHGQPCTTSLEHHFLPILKDNTVQHNPDWYSEQDHIRQKYLRELLSKGGKLCNPFSLLTCQHGKCSCGPNRFYDPKFRRCVLKTGSPCGPNLQTKEFRFHLSGNSNHFSTGILIYHWSPVECEQQDCTEVEHGVMFCTSEPMHYHYTLNRRFTLRLGQTCNEAEETSVFAARTNMEPAEAMDDLRAHFTRLRNHPEVEFCKLTKHAMCKNNICVCIPPLVAENDTCVAPQHVKCYDASDEIEAHLNGLLQIVGNIPVQSYMELLCATEMSCKAASPMDSKRFCTCSNDMHGDDCKIQSSSFVSFLGKEQRLPSSLLTEDGLKALDLAHVTLRSLEDRMTFKSGDTCNLKHNLEFGVLFDFFRTIHQKGCGPSSFCTTDQFNAINDAGMQLFKQGPTLCNRVKNFVCVNSICECPPYTYEERDECHLEVGSPCHDRMGVMNEGFVIRCRSGTSCVNGHCQITQTRFIQNWETKENGGEAYVMEIYMLFLNFYSARMMSVLRQRVTVPGGSCSQMDEQTMTSFVEAVKPLLQEATQFSTKSLSEKIQMVRLLQSLENNDVTLVPNFGPLCNPSSTCGSEGRCVSLLERDVEVTTEEGVNSAVSIILPHFLAQLLAHVILCLL